MTHPDPTLQMDDTDRSSRRWREDLPNHELGDDLQDGNPWTVDEDAATGPSASAATSMAKGGAGPKQIQDSVDQDPIRSTADEPQPPANQSEPAPDAPSAPPTPALAAIAGPVEPDPIEAVAPTMSSPLPQNGLPDTAIVEADRADVSPPPAPVSAPQAGADLGWSDDDLQDAGALPELLGQLLQGGGDGMVNLFLDVETLDVDIFNIVQNTLMQTTEILFDASNGGSIDVGGDVTALGSQTAMVDDFDGLPFFS